jgi:Putative lumazine-binding
MAARGATFATERDAVLNVLERFVEGLRTRDGQIWRDLFVEKAASFAYRRDAGGKWVPNFRKNEDWLPILAVEERSLDQTFGRPIIHIRGPIAMIWAPYELIRDGKRAHGGIDCFSLIKVKDAWKIFSIVSTQEPDSAR